VYSEPADDTPTSSEYLAGGNSTTGFNREQSAEYIGVSPTQFDELVADGRMPKPKRIDGRVVWDRLQLDLAFAALPDADGRGDIWSKAAV
jgi:predicted DNA-binding transcriptional regulator AlpA